MQFFAIIGARRRRDPRRLRLGHIGAKARDDVNVQLRHRIAERRAALAATGENSHH
jgi:hypothetical protein